MPIEIRCSSCDAVLRVADEHAGKSARCPQCSAIVPIPLTPLPDSPPEPSEYQNQPPPHHQPAGSSNPFAQPSHAAAAGVGAGARMGTAAHRGPTILVLGIVGLVCCVFAAIPAIIMANEDLRKMDNGIMNPDGRGLTQAGKVIGIVSLVINGIVIVLQIVFMMIGVAAQGANF